MTPKEKASKLRSFADSLDGKAEDAILKQIDKTKKRFASNTYWKNGSNGTLLKSFEVRKVSAHHISLVSDYDVADYLDRGTEDHSIVPVNKKALAFKIKGRWVIVKHCNVKGIKAKNYSKKESELGEKELVRFCDEAIKQAKRIAGL